MEKTKGPNSSARRLITSTARERLQASGVSPLLDEYEHAAYRGVTVSKVRAERLAGGGPEYIKDGRHVRYRLHAIDTFLDARKTASTTQPA